MGMLFVQKSVQSSDKNGIWYNELESVLLHGQGVKSFLSQHTRLRELSLPC